ncbi:unnamed protein product [Aspergillus oryzae]|uniref:Polynucleotide 5'-hydroxyl-kinase GRC3 n=1 Tax=Aspergillus oryzae TaxID=5062 RepID=A0AAN4YH92_ASPOZ|nr:unnamed protein product [Aspergillus oryzae]
MSAVAARKARQQQMQAAIAVVKPSQAESVQEPPSKKARRSPEQAAPTPPASGEPQGRTTRSSKRKAESLKVDKLIEKKEKTLSAEYTEQLPVRSSPQEQEDQSSSDEESEEQNPIVGENDAGIAPLRGDVDGPAPQTETNYCNTDGVAFLDLDPGQPEFSPMGQVYLAHLRSPVFGPPFSHPSLDSSQEGTIIRAHHIGATSPKEDPDHYVLAAMDLMDRYRALLASYPQCPLIINYPGWIFGLGLEVATWLVRSLGLSDVVYMSEKGPTEVVMPLGQAAQEAMAPLTILPSQPTDFVSRSSAQLRSMQMQSYFHMTRPTEISNPLWLEKPISRTRPFHVHYAGPKQGIKGVMVMGSQIDPDLLQEVLDGSIVAVVAVESPQAILGQNDGPGLTINHPAQPIDADVTMDDSTDTPMEGVPLQDPINPFIDANIVRTPTENLPYLFVGSGSSNPLDPKASRCLGLALVRSIDVSSQRLELVTPIAGSAIRDALEQSHGIVLVRGQLDNPNWAISEDYYAARAEERRYRESLEKLKKNEATTDKEDSIIEPEQQARVSAILRDRIRRASNVPWMTVIEDNSGHQREAAQREKSLWKLRKKAYPGSDSEGDW